MRRPDLVEYRRLKPNSVLVVNLLWRSPGGLWGTRWCIRVFPGHQTTSVWHVAWISREVSTRRWTNGWRVPDEANGDTLERMVAWCDQR